MKVSELGEFGLIDLLAEIVYSQQDSKAPPWQQLIIGIGDDAAVWKSDTRIQMATVDSLIENIHFSLDTTPWKELGWKSLAVNLSDIAAMGGLPSYALIALALPGNTEVEDATSFYQGMMELAEQAGLAIVGGDISQAPMVIITITVLGIIRDRDKHMLTRSTAQPGDKVAVTGYLGSAAAGLDMLTAKQNFDAETTTVLRNAFLKPQPRIAEGGLLVEHGIKTAIDISDGLVSDLKHVCRASKVGARIEADRIPVHPLVIANFGSRALELALAGGEDYELLFTGSMAAIDNVKKAAACPVTVIGEITAERKGEVSLIDGMGKAIDLAREGWDHFTT